ARSIGHETNRVEASAIGPIEPDFLKRPLEAESVAIAFAEPDEDEALLKDEIEEADARVGQYDHSQETDEPPHRANLPGTPCPHVHTSRGAARIRSRLLSGSLLGTRPEHRPQAIGDQPRRRCWRRAFDPHGRGTGLRTGS